MTMTTCQACGKPIEKLISFDGGFSGFALCQEHVAAKDRCGKCGQKWDDIQAARVHGCQSSRLSVSSDSSKGGGK